MTNPLYTIFPLALLLNIALYYNPRETVIILVWGALTGIAGLLVFAILYLMADPDELL